LAAARVCADHDVMETGPQIAAQVRLAGGRLLDVLLPPHCPACGAETDRHGALCTDCWRALELIAEPCCATCGLPFGEAVPPGAQCGACLAAPPPYERARALFVYDAASRGLVRQLKYADRTDLAPFLGRWLAQAGRDLLDGADLIAPVPLHRRRLLHRRFNQSALLARHMDRESGVAAVPDLLARSRATPSQTGLSASQRRRNLQGAIVVRPRHAQRLRGARIVLVDDVLTTGATVSACTRVLQRAGAASVAVLTLARTVQGG
jgi:ComF family protein